MRCTNFIRLRFSTRFIINFGVILYTLSILVGGLGFGLDLDNFCGEASSTGYLRIIGFSSLRSLIPHLLRFHSTLHIRLTMPENIFLLYIFTSCLKHSFTLKLFKIFFPLLHLGRGNSYNLVVTHF